MILLDTNVLSEFARATPTAAALAWARGVTVSDVCTTVIAEAELRFGVALLPAGQRQVALARAVEDLLTRVVQGRILPFDRAAAPIYATLAATRRRHGRSVDTADLQIQAIARAHAVMAIATRNIADFSDCGVPLIDPWQGP